MVNPVYSGETMDKKEPVRRERREDLIGRVNRELWSWFMDTDVDSMEKFFMSFQFTLAIVLIAFRDILIAQPPPLVQHYIPTPPVILWVSLFAIALTVSGFGRAARNICNRRNGAMIAFFTCLGIVGPAYLKTPLFASLLVAYLVWQGVLTARLIRLCQESKPKR